MICVSNTLLFILRFVLFPLWHAILHHFILCSVFFVRSKLAHSLKVLSDTLAMKGSIKKTDI